MVTNNTKPQLATNQIFSINNAEHFCPAKKAGNAKGTIKRWKDHIQKWGMDTSYTKAFNIGGKLNSNGWGGLLSYEKRIGAGQTRFSQLSFSEIKHEKQVKQQGTNPLFPELGKATPYVFGKINNLYVLQLGVGKEQLLLPGIGWKYICELPVPGRP